MTLAFAINNNYYFTYNFRISPVSPVGAEALSLTFIVLDGKLIVAARSYKKINDND